MGKITVSVGNFGCLKNVTVEKGTTIQEVLYEANKEQSKDTVLCLNGIPSDLETPVRKDESVLLLIKDRKNGM